MTPTADVRVMPHGTIYLFEPLTDRAATWFDAHTPDATRWAGSIVVEHRYALTIYYALTGDGLTVSLT